MPTSDAYIGRFMGEVPSLLEALDPCESDVDVEVRVRVRDELTRRKRNLYSWNEAFRREWSGVWTRA